MTRQERGTALIWYLTARLADAKQITRWCCRMLRNLKRGKDHVLSNRYFPRSRRHRHFVHCYRCLGTRRRGRSGWPRGRGLRRGRRYRGRRWSNSSAILCSATVRCSPIQRQACVWILSLSTLQKTLSDHATSLVTRAAPSLPLVRQELHSPPSRQALARELEPQISE